MCGRSMADCTRIRRTRERIRGDALFSLAPRLSLLIFLVVRLLPSFETRSIEIGCCRFRSFFKCRNRVNPISGGALLQDEVRSISQPPERVRARGLRESDINPLGRFMRGPALNEIGAPTATIERRPWSKIKTFATCGK
jgi:hypothetical protein